MSEAYGTVPRKLKKTYDTPQDSERKRRDANNGSGDLTAHLNVPSISEEECLEIGACLRPVSSFKGTFINSYAYFETNSVTMATFASLACKNFQNFQYKSTVNFNKIFHIDTADL